MTGEIQAMGFSPAAHKAQVEAEIRKYRTSQLAGLAANHARYRSELNAEISEYYTLSTKEHELKNRLFSATPWNRRSLKEQYSAAYSQRSSSGNDIDALLSSLLTNSFDQLRLLSYSV